MIYIDYKMKARKEYKNETEIFLISWSEKEDLR